METLELVVLKVLLENRCHILLVQSRKRDPISCGNSGFLFLRSTDVSSLIFAHSVKKRFL